jgi:heme peroxidase
MQGIRRVIALAILSGVPFTGSSSGQELALFAACGKMIANGLRPIATDRDKRFQGKVEDFRARCRGGDKAVRFMPAPWVDWSNYWGTGDATSKSGSLDTGLPILDRDRNKRGVNFALEDLEYQRMELIKFNLFDNNKTFQQYATGRVIDGKLVAGPTLKTWKEMRLPPDHPSIRDLDVKADGEQACKGQLIRFRTVTGICNDVQNPAMGSTGQLFARNVQFEATFPDLEQSQVTANRHGGRLTLLRPDPQVISRKLFTRDQTGAVDCNEGHGAPGSTNAECPYKKAPFFNVLAAYWIQFMTHDWFSHLDQARNDQSRIMAGLGCTTQRVGNVEHPLTTEDVARLGCRKDDKMEAALIAEGSPPATFKDGTVDRLTRAYKTTSNNVTAWWDASQIYGYDEASRRRMRRDPSDSAKLDLSASHKNAKGEEEKGYLPDFRSACAPGAATDQCDPIQPEWTGQEATAFPDNWSIGLSFYHNLFIREHNNIVDAFRDMAKKQPNEDSGLRNPDNPAQAITYSQISNDELFEIARLIVAAEIAKIHTIEWTTQLLYDEPLYLAMNSNWSGLFEKDSLAATLTKAILQKLAKSSKDKVTNQLFSALAAGAGIVGLDQTNHFGSPFNFPEEFVSVYRLHPLVPDLLEFRALDNDPNVIREKIPVIDTFRAKATSTMRSRGLASWALTMGRQRLGLLALRNHPQFLQNLDLRPRLDTKIDVPALDIIRDRERGVPRFNEFRRQIGLRQLTSFDDFVDQHLLQPPQLPENEKELARQRDLVATLREVYGQHRCDASKIITTAQLDQNGRPINDCLGRKTGDLVDNIEDVDLSVGWLGETTRPHGFAISETQFHIFILNASRRLFSDRFFTSSFRPEFYTKLGIAWVNDNGPTGKQLEPGEPNGHKEQAVSPLKRILLRAMPELDAELKHVVNIFDPWARDRGEYYSLDWKPRADATSDKAFQGP